MTTSAGRAGGRAAGRTGGRAAGRTGGRAPPPPPPRYGGRRAGSEAETRSEEGDVRGFSGLGTTLSSKKIK